MDFQFYPTPASLANRMWQKFKNKNFVRVLEGSAGNGDLADAGRPEDKYHRRGPTIDCCEIDPRRHPILQEKGFDVVGLDFLQFAGGSIYSHIIINPPFRQGVQHVLKAWDCLWDGEVVALVNAETVRNPNSQERAHLVRLIEMHGSVEFLQSAFETEDTERKTEVEVALIYLCKKADFNNDIVGSLYDDLREDQNTAREMAQDFKEDLLPTLPNSEIENTVLLFNAAVQAMRDSVFMQARSRYYTAMLSDTMANRIDGKSSQREGSVEWVRQSIAEQYYSLKDRAWAGILRSSNVISHLSSAAQKRLESEFDKLKKLEFTVSNVYGFILGLMEKQAEIQLQMACDIFDRFSRYHDKNTVFFRGWKSNSKHRTCGMRLRATRFVMPGSSSSSFHSGIGYETTRMLGDFDKVFALLDGKRAPDTSLVSVFDNHFSELRTGARISSSYFDVRYYPGIGTIHFFPREKKLVDRLNRLVGKHRQWLPPEDSEASKGFWQQYDQAEHLDKEIRSEVAKTARNHSFGWGGPFSLLTGDVEGRYAEENRAAALAVFDEASGSVLARHGISTEFQIETPQQQVLALSAT